MTVKVTEKGLKAGQTEIPLILGAMHYWRIERRLWADILDKVAQMGFGMIETYVPWSVHETSRGGFDFGKRDRNKDLDAFLTLCRDRGMWVMVRPGPHINSELTYFGYPKRVLLDPECRAVSAQGSPVILPAPFKSFPVPSYAGEKFYREVGTWFDNVCPIIEKHLYPEGAVVAVQADNENSFFFRTNAYDLDYSEGSIKLYREYLQSLYNDIGELNRAYRSNYSGFGEVEPPRRFAAARKEDLPFYMDWVAYKEYYLIYGLKRIKDMLADRGVNGIPVTHNYPTPQVISPFNIADTEREIDIQGFDMYPTRRDYRGLKYGCLAARAQSRLSFIPEFGSGGWLWNPPLSKEDQQFATKAIFMHGIRAVSYYMLVERERWYGAPIARDGRVRTGRYDFYTQMNEVLKKMDYLDLDPGADILLTRPRSYQRLENASTILEPMTTLVFRAVGAGPEFECSEQTFGFEKPVQIEADKWFNRWYRTLERAKLPFEVGDTSTDAESMKKYPLQIVPTFEFMAEWEMQRLLDYAKSGGTLVMGPKIPDLDEKMDDCSILAEAVTPEPEPLEGFDEARIYRVGKGAIVLIPQLPEEKETRKSAAEALAAQAGITLSYRISDDKLETRFHKRNGGGVLFAANPTGEERSGKVNFEGKKKFEDLWSGEITNAEGELDLKIPPYTVRMMEVST